MPPRDDGSFGPIEPRQLQPYAPISPPVRSPVYLPAEGAGPVGLGHLLTQDPFEHFNLTDEELETASYVSAYGDTPDAKWDEFTRSMMRSSCAFFAQEVLQGPPEAPYDGRFMVSEHHEEWDDLIAEHDRICVLAPRDSGKTFFFDFAFPIWKIFYGPRTNGFIFSSTKPQAARILMDIIEELESNPELQWLVPAKKKVWSNSHIQLSNGSHIYARGFGTRVRGAHPHWIVVDDGLNDETAYSEVVRNKQIDYFFSAITNMIRPGGQIITVGTPFHACDLYAELRDNVEYEYRQYKAIIDEEKGIVMWPERYPLERLLARKREIGSIRFNREFQCCKPGTLIETSKGSMPIEEVRVGDIVLTHRGRWRTVTEVMCNDFEGELIKIKSSLFVTPNHPVFTQEDWVEAGDLVTTDLVTYPRPDRFDEVPSEISVVEGSSVPYLLTPDKSRAYCRGSARHLLSGSVGKSGAKSIPVKMKLDWDLLYLFGLWLAEGSLGSKGRALIFSFGYGEENTLAKVAQEIIARKFGLKARIEVTPRGDGGVTKVILCNRLLGDLFFRLFGSFAGKKRLPLWMRDLSPDLLWPLILGYVDGDGHVDTKASARVSSVSRLLLTDIQFALARCGLFSSLRLAHKGGPSKILGRDVVCRPSWVLTISGGGYTAFKRRELPPRAHSWSRVQGSLDRIPYRGPVYNFEVEEDHSYVADGVAVHNCVPIADDMSLFPSYLFIGDPIEQPSIRLGMPLEYWIEHVGIQGVYTGVDFALSASVRADYTVIWTMGLDKFGNRWIMDIVRGHGLPYQQQLSLINATGRLYKPGLIYCEANQAQTIFGTELIRTTDLPIKLFVTGAAKNTLDKGVPSLRVLLENRKFRIPRGDRRSIILTDMWKEEMHNITFLEGKVQSVGAHDDLAMATWLCDQACRMGAFSFTFGSEEEYQPKPGEQNIGLDDDTGDPLGLDQKGNGGDGDGEPGTASGNLFDDSYIVQPIPFTPR